MADNHGIVPYDFEPEMEYETDEEQGEQDERNDDDEVEQEAPIPEERLGHRQWCVCHNCQIMTFAVECVCCHEIPNVARKIPEDKKCILDNSEFSSVALTRGVLEVLMLQMEDIRGYRADMHGWTNRYVREANCSSK